MPMALTICRSALPQLPTAGKAEAAVPAAAEAAADRQGAAHPQQSSFRGRQSIGSHVQVVIFCKQRSVNRIWFASCPLCNTRCSMGGDDSFCFSSLQASAEQRWHCSHGRWQWQQPSRHRRRQWHSSCRCHGHGGRQRQSSAHRQSARCQCSRYTAAEVTSRGPCHARMTLCVRRC